MNMGFRLSWMKHTERILDSEAVSRKNAVKLGADAVIMSLHKTLPSFTQTALLHLASDLIDEKRVERYLSIYETSSPSYIFMAGMDSCIRLIAEHGQQLFVRIQEASDSFLLRKQPV